MKLQLLPFSFRISTLYYSILLFSISCTTLPENNTIPPKEPEQNTLETIINDMTLPHEGSPAGVPDSYDWAKKPKVGYGNNPPENWSAMIPWGQVYSDKKPITATNTRIQLKNMQAWYLSKTDSVWRQWVNTSDMSGAYYSEDFQDDYNTEAIIRKESSGGISVKLIEGFNFHFWSTAGRVEIDPKDILGVWISMEARLIVNNPDTLDDRAAANFMLSVGGDYWESLSAPWDYWTTNGDIAIGRFKYIENHWKPFNMHTVSAELLDKNPPPF